MPQQDIYAENQVTERVSIRKGHIPSPRGDVPQNEGGDFKADAFATQQMPFDVAAKSPVKELASKEYESRDALVDPES